MDIKKKKTQEKTPKKSKAEHKHVSELSLASKSLAIVVGGIWVVGLFVATISLIYSVVYTHVTFPGAQLSGKDVSNLSRSDLQKSVEKRVSQVNDTTWKLSYRDKKAEGKASDLGFNFDPSKTTEVIWNYGRTENFLVNFKDQLVGLLASHNFSPVETVTTSTAQEFISSKLSDEKEQPKNASLTFKGSAIHIESSNPGRVLDAGILVNDIANEIARGTTNTIQVVGYARTPDVTTAIARESRQKVVALMSQPITLKYQSQTWTLDAKDIASWITPTVAEVTAASNKIVPENNTIITLDDNTATLSFTDKPQTDLVLTQTKDEIQDILNATENLDSPLNIREFAAKEFGLKRNVLGSNASILAIAIDKAKLDKTFDPITKKIDIPGRNVRLSFNDGKITVIEKSEDGRGVDRKDALQHILEAVNEGGSHNISLVVNTIPAKVTENNFESLGIKELLATGDSNFKGSPKNRQHNIHTAASHFEGVLVAPGEEFSFVNYLGDVDASTGYLPELVIKGNKITPEYGGGVCQVSSTLFRAAVYSGLEITERQNHSFVVSYYGTPGMDATIYIPHPDLRFVNNTPGYILMQPRFDGTHLSFDIFGTKDGRKVETQGPFIYDRGAGNAMKATWTQIVTTASGETKTKVFKSNYKPVTDFVHTN